MEPVMTAPVYARSQRGPGVTAMLVDRYFGSKEQLFAEAVTESMAITSMQAAKIIKPDAFGKAIATAFLLSGDLWHDPEERRLFASTAPAAFTCRSTPWRPSAL